MSGAAEFRELMMLLGRDDQERMSICYGIGQSFTSVLTTVGQAGAIVETLADGNVWYGIAGLHPRVQHGRGLETDAVSIREMCPDCDVSPGKFANYDDVLQFITNVSKVLGQRPVAVVFTGHGLQPHWAIESEPGVTDWVDETSAAYVDAKALMARFRRLVIYEAGKLGAKLDNVYDLSRVLRVPGTHNTKDMADPIPTMIMVKEGSPLAYGGVLERLDEYGYPEMDGDRKPIPVTVSNPENWAYSTSGCDYAARMISGWRTDTPKDGARHPWLLSQMTRLAAAHRAGCLLEADHDRATLVLTKRFQQLLTILAPQRPEGRGEIEDCRLRGIKNAAGKNISELGKELGGFPHKTHPGPEEREQWQAENPSGGAGPCQEPGDPTGEEDEGRRLQLTWADTIIPKRVVWGWKTNETNGRIPAGSLTLMAGREGTGKSSAAIWFCAQITAGTLPGSYFGVPRRVLYCAAEDSWEHTLVPRLMAAGADLAMVARVEVVEKKESIGVLTLPHDIDSLKLSIRDNDVALLVLDPLMSYMHARLDTHKSADVRQALDPMAKLADATGAIVLAIAHFNKASGSDAATLITGSGAFKDVPRAVFGFARKKDGTGVVSQVKNSLGLSDLPHLSYEIKATPVSIEGGAEDIGMFMMTGESNESVGDVLSDAAGGTEKRTKTDLAVEWLNVYLREHGGSVDAEEVKKAAKDGEGISESTLHRARIKLCVQSYQPVHKGPFIWRFPLFGGAR